MFTLATDPTFTHPVKVKVPADNGFIDQDFSAKFRVLPIEQSAKFDLTDGASTADFLRAVLIDVTGVVTDANAAIPYSDTLRDALIEVPFVRAAIVATYFAAIGGAKLGN